jgi:hypothetical protein
MRWAEVVALVAAVAAARADDPKPKGDSPKPEPHRSAAERYQALRKEYDAPMQRFQQEYKAAKTDEEREKAKEHYSEVVAAIAQRIVAVAEEHPNDPATTDALILAFSTTRPGPEKQRALAALLKDHVTSDKLAPVGPRLVFVPGGEKALRTLLEKNPHRDVRGNACFSLARVLKDRAGRGGADAAATLKEAEALFERAAREFADVKQLGWAIDRPLGRAAEGELFELRHLSVGQEAPEIEGEDIDGVRFKLSDYRGKVVLLDFWGHW